MKHIIFFLASSLLLISCSGYISRMHNQIDSELEIKRNSQTQNRNRFSFYKDPYARQKGVIDPKTTSSSDIHNLQPNIKREYRNMDEQRYTTDDLKDNSNPGSLWSGVGQGNFLFSKNKILKNGDIVVLLVEKDMKNEITVELKRAFPGKSSPPTKAGKEPATATTPSVPPGEEKTDDQDKSLIFDKISSVIVEEINKDHLLVRGRKDVLFQKLKRLIEIEVLVARRDVSDEDTVLSSQQLKQMCLF